ncbi:MAG: ABC transporter ATP-binding protein [Pirellulales bacterium]|nr:ABC transporter ATP-binding protein [Pirellulales bacterium]
MHPEAPTSFRGIRVDHLSKRFIASTWAVNDLSLAVAAGEMLVLLGASGCGKTTTLRMIAGLEAPTTGEIEIDGRRVTRLPPHRRGVSLVFQEHPLYPHLSVAEQFRFGIAPSERDAAAERSVAQALGIDGLVGRFPRDLSGGERQRVALARGLLRRRAVTLLDEPLSNVDPPLRAEIRRQVREQGRQNGAATIYVTHDVPEALAIADRIAILQQGRIEQIGTAASVLAEPANRYVAGFVGGEHCSFVRGKVVVAAGGAEFLGGGWTLPLVCPPLACIGRQMILGVRPGAVQLADGQMSGGIEAEVRAVYTFAEGMIAELAPPALAMPADVEFSTRLKAFVPLRRTVTPGERVVVTLDASQLWWLDAESGDRWKPTS